MKKNVLLIGGGGTLGGYTAKELTALGHDVDVICLEDMPPKDGIRYFKATADKEFLENFLKGQHYDGIINFIHYPNVDDYKPIHKLLSENTGHVIFLSSYRVYADLQHPITEAAPFLYDTLKDSDFFENEKYSVSKAKAEYFLREESGTSNWTVVRPVISFSDRRLDIVTRSGYEVIERSQKGEEMLLPEICRNITAGLDWAGNTGKIIARLLFKKQTFKEAYTISSAQNLTWGEVADIYTELLGARFKWVSTEEYINDIPYLKADPWIFKYDRAYDRCVDNSKVLGATGLCGDDFVSIRDGIKTELAKLLQV